MSPSLAQQIFDAIGSALVLHENFGGPAPTLGEDLELEAILGAGGFGLICRAMKRSLQRRVAVKIFALGGQADQGIREALREARSLARLEHPGIVTVHAAGEAELVAGDRRLACAYVEMQLIAGRTLRDWLVEVRPEARAVLAVLLEAGRALAYAHEHAMLHRDFKPDNVMVDEDGHARVIDFGLALVAEARSRDAALDEWDSSADALGSRVTSTGLVRGTPGYMAPESMQGQPQAAGDQFALAVVIREALTGRHPFLGSDDERPAQVPAGGEALFEQLRPALDRAMAPSPGDRFASVAALCDALEAAARPRRSPGRIILAVGAVAIAGLALALGLEFVDEGAGEELPIASSAENDTPEAATPEARDAATSEAGEAPSETGDEEPGAKEDGPSTETGVTAAGCEDLGDWSGTWQVGTKVLWTEYAYQHDWRVVWELELGVGERCNFEINARKYPPLEPGEPRGEALVAEPLVVAAIREPSGEWRVPFELAFPEDGRTYAKPEHYRATLVLDRAGTQPRLRGAFHKSNEDGHPIRSGLFAGSRGLAPQLRSITSDELACAQRCRIECAGERSARACVEGGCAPYEAEGPAADICGPPSFDYVPPLRSTAARRTVSLGEDLFEKSLAQNRQAQLRACRVHARALAGSWGLWASSPNGAQHASFEVQAEGCELRGTMRAGEASAEYHGAVTGVGTWVLELDAPLPGLTSPLILVGVHPEGPAFGVDLDDPRRELRAYRR